MNDAVAPSETPERDAPAAKRPAAADQADLPQEAPFSGVSGLLVAGLAATAFVGAPLQFVRPDNIKSAFAAIFVAAALALWAWKLEKGSAVRWSRLLLVPAGLVAFAVASVAWSPAATALSDAVKWLVMGAIMFLALNAMGRDSFQGIARAAFWGALFVSLLALGEFWLGFSWFPTEAPPGGNFGNRNYLAEFLAVALPFAAWWLLRRSTVNTAVLTGLGVGVIFVALMSTGARAALIAGALGVPCVVLVHWLCTLRDGGSQRTPTLRVAALLPVLLTVGALGWLPTSNAVIASEGRGLTPAARTASRILSLGAADTYADGTSFGIRLAAWRAGVRIIGDRPVLGAGAGGWNAASALYATDEDDLEIVWLAHNEPLQLVAEYGVAGWIALLCFLGLLASAVLDIARRLHQRVAIDDALQESVAVISIVAFCLVSLSGNPLHVATTCYLLALSIGWLLACRATRVARLDAAGSAPVRLGRWATVAFFALTAAVSMLALRSDFLVQRSGGILTGIGQAGVAGSTVTAQREAAARELRAAYDIFENQELQTQVLINLFAKLGDPASVVWLSQAGLKTRPYVATLSCSLARAQFDLGRHDDAKATLDAIEKIRPRANCISVSRLDMAVKKGNFADALAFGQKYLGQVGATAKPELVRFVIDTTYRAAIRVPDMPAAMVLLEQRAARFPELGAQSRMLMGQLQAAQVPGQVSTDAVASFRQALSLATEQERAQIRARLPEAYRASVN